MPTTDTVVIGAGHAGLAVSRLLTAAGRDHVVLDRGRIAERWRTERWDSLHLLSPNWMTRLPGCTLAGADPDGYLAVEDLVRRLEDYGASFDAPVVTGATVRRVSDASTGYRVGSDAATWRTKQVVIATGPHGVPRIPAGLDPEVVLTANRYRNPASLSPGGVLVVGASASGVQIADELAGAGRVVVLAVGRHSRMPRRYRGRDAFCWLDVTGRLARTIDEVPNPSAAPFEPSFQLTGRSEADRRDADLDLATLSDRGVRLVGRLLGIDSGIARLGDNLAADIAAADGRLCRLLDSVDRYVEHSRTDEDVPPGVRPRPVGVPAAPSRLDLRAEGITTVLVAAGYRPRFEWLELPITDSTGRIRQRRGVTAAPGVYVVGQRFQHRRDSAFIDGARHDALDVVAHLVGSRSAVQLAELAS
jgi:putative flavoprotein involved in K+ transport